METTSVIILSRTKMRNNICVGAFDINNKKMLRLLDDKARNLDSSCQYNIGEIYKINYEPRCNITPPHVEDVAVYSSSSEEPVNEAKLKKYVTANSVELKNLSCLFEGKLLWENKKGYISPDNHPNFSVQIAKLDTPLYKKEEYYKDVFHDRMIKYIGEINIANLPNIIEPKTHIRFSLARPWDKDGNGDKRCYLQLSGVYSIK